VKERWEEMERLKGSCASLDPHLSSRGVLSDAGRAEEDRYGESTKDGGCWVQSDFFGDALTEWSPSAV